MQSYVCHACNCKLLYITFTEMPQRSQHSHYIKQTACTETSQAGGCLQGLREWVEWHKSMGVGRFYIMDYDSSKPTGREIADYISSGLVDLFFR